MKRLFGFGAALSVVLIALSATAANAQQPPSPEQVQAWATTLPRQSTSQLDPVYSPIDVIHVLDRTYSVMLQDFSQNRPGDAWTKAGEGSKIVDHFRRFLVHSPDNNLNRLTNTALSQVGDVFDEVNTTNTRQAALKAPASNLLWAQIEATLKQYGVDTGDPWTLSTAK
jgi:hypothetical protein